MGSQTSGSITFDTANLATAVVKGLEPVLGALSVSLGQLSAVLSPVLSPDDTAQTLLDHLPVVAGMDPNHAVNMARFLAASLAEAGYALIRIQVTEPVGPLDPAAVTTARQDEWFNRDGSAD